MPKNKYPHTLKGLKKLSKAYSLNFKKLRKCKLNSREHTRLLKIERDFWKKDKAIRKTLNITATDPCELTKPIVCADCTGYYKKIEKIYPCNFKYIKFKTRTTYVQCEKSSPEATRCELKFIHRNDFVDLFSFLRKMRNEYTIR